MLLKKNVTATFFSNDGEAVILNKDNTKGVLLKGYFDKDFKNLEITNNNKFFGKIGIQKYDISIGKELSSVLNVEVGDTIALMSPIGIQTIVGALPKQEIFKISSVFEWRNTKASVLTPATRFSGVARSPP